MNGSQLCAGCGHPTAAGHRRFADRVTIELADGTRGYLCGMCGATAEFRRVNGQLTDEELRRAGENGAAVGALWSGGGLGIGL